ncbi:MAG TPA: protein kinase [Kofleriaceae bacterium]
MKLATMIEDSDKRHTVTVGRYLLHKQIARGGMATIHIARLMGDEGFSRIVAAKRLLPEFAEDTEFVSMFMDEARIASKVHHPNVVPVLDLVTTSDEVMLVQEYVHGVPLHVLLRTAHEANQKIPVRIAVCIAAQVLAGLHAAHTTVDELGAPLDIVHRDVSPQNVMIAVDGSARLLDFGVAKATMAAHVTRDGTFKGKLAYSAPEQVRSKPCQQSDVYSLAVVLWELLVGHRMHGSTQGEAELVATIMTGAMPTVTEALSNEADWGAIDSDEWKLLAAIEPIVAKGLAVNLADRYATAYDMEEELVKAVPPASTSEVATWVKSIGKGFIEGRDRLIAAEEASWRRTHANIATQPGVRRLTPVPGEMRRPSQSEIQRAATVPPPPVALALPSGRGGRAIIALLCALVVLLGVGVVFAMRSGENRPQPAAPPARPEAMPAAAVEPAPAPPVEEPKPVPVAEPEPTEPAPVAATPEPTTPAASEPAAEQDKPKPAVTREAPAVRRVSRPVPRPAVVKTEKKKEEPPPPPPIKQAIPEAKPAAADKPKDDCNPPYYFEGQKKVFKPNCL